MKNTVVWVPSSEPELAQILLDARDRDEVTYASAKIEEYLRLNP